MSAQVAVARVKSAHAQGKLLVHMFECPLSDETGVHNTCAVLNGEEGSRFSTVFRDVQAAPQGYRGLATTALKDGYSVPVWNSCSNVGLIFNADDKHVRLLHVCGRDAYSRVADDKLELNPNETPHFQSLIDMQPLEPGEWCGGVIDLAKTHQLPQIERQARAALDELWKRAEGGNWARLTGSQAHPSELNEINVIAHLKGLQGILVAETDYDRNPALETPENFAAHVNDALRIREQIATRHLHVDPESLPIFTYHFSRAHGQLCAMTPAQLENPEQYFLKRQATAPRQQVRKGWAI